MNVDVPEWVECKRGQHEWKQTSNNSRLQCCICNMLAADNSNYTHGRDVNQRFYIMSHNEFTRFNKQKED